jgi:4-hydroxy-3-methylbut-2-enyl diphosphate reductase
VHNYYAHGRELVLIGHAGHPEIIGTMGQLPEGAVTLIETVEQARTFTPRNPDKLAYATQTTLSVDDTAEIVAVLQERFPQIVGPHKEDICYATTNRQAAVKAIAPKVERFLVVGAPNSSNSLRLVEVAERAGCKKAALVQRATDVDWSDLAGVLSVGLTASASAPEELVDEVINAFRERFDVTVDTVTTAQERIAFNVPRELRDVAPPRKQTASV